MPDFSGLGDLGFLKPTQANSSDDLSKVDMLEQLLAGSSDTFDELGRARVLESKMAQLDSAKKPSILDQLLSPQGLVSLLGTVGAGIAGGPAAAAGFGIGRLGTVDAAAEAKLAQTRKAREELAKQHENALDRLDKSRQRFTTLLQAQPELFIDPVTGQQTVSPKLLGFYATGEPVALSPASKRALDKADDSWKKTNDILTDQLANAQTDDDAKKILDAIFVNLDAKNIPEDLKDSLARSRKDGTWNQSTADMIARYFPKVAADAFIMAGENKVPLHDPMIMRLLKGNYQDPDSHADKVEVSDKFIQAGAEIAAWQSDPTNLKRIGELRTEVTSENEFSLLLAEEVLGGKRDLFDIYKKQAGLFDPKDLAMTMSAYDDVKAGNKMADTIAGYESLPTRAAMSEEEKRAADWAQAQEQVKAAKQTVKDNQGKQDISLVSQHAKRLQTELNLGAKDASQLANDIAKKALFNATRPDGKVDRARFEQELRKLTDETIKGAKE